MQTFTGTIYVNEKMFALASQILFLVEWNSIKITLWNASVDFGVLWNVSFDFAKIWNFLEFLLQTF